MGAILQLASAEKAIPDLRSVPALLRNIAERIEAGDYGIGEAQAIHQEVICRGALVLRVSGMEPQIFGLGDTDPNQSFVDFHAAAAELLSMQSPERA